MTPSPDAIDRLVAGHLAAEAATVDAHAFLAKLRQREVQDRPTVAPPRPPFRVWNWRVAVAASLLVAIVLGGQRNPALASPEALVREAQLVHAQPVDRCYKVWVDPDPELARQHPALDRQRENRLWTRGDRFYIEDAFLNRRGTWGRDETGTIWLAPDDRTGLIYTPLRLPPPVAALLATRELHIETLLNDVLRDFTLVDVGTTPAGDRKLRADLKPGRRHLTLLGAELTIDPQRREVQRLVLHRALGGRPLGTVTFSLRQSTTLPDDAYRLSGHVRTGADVYGPDRPLLRQRQLLRVLSPF